MHPALHAIVVGVGQLEVPDPHLGTAIRLASEHGASLYAIRAFRLPDPLVAAYPEVATYDPEVAHAAEQAVLRRLQEQVARQGGKDVECRTLPGPADAAIVTLAEDVAADLIVVGATERGAISRAVLGTTAGRVIRTASAPVLINRNADRRELRRVLLTTDLSELSGRMYQVGIRLASTLGAAHEELRALLVVDEDTIGPENLAGIEQNDLTPFLARWEPDDLQSRPRVRTGDAATEILAEGEEWPADLIVVGTHGRGGLSRMLIGSVAEEVARRASCDVLVIPAAAFGTQMAEDERTE